MRQYPRPSVSFLWSEFDAGGNFPEGLDHSVELVLVRTRSGWGFDACFFGDDDFDFFPELFVGVDDLKHGEIYTVLLLVGIDVKPKHKTI